MQPASRSSTARRCSHDASSSSSTCCSTPTAEQQKARFSQQPLVPRRSALDDCQRQDHRDRRVHRGHRRPGRPAASPCRSRHDRHRGHDRPGPANATVVKQDQGRPGRALRGAGRRHALPGHGPVRRPRSLGSRLTCRRTPTPTAPRRRDDSSRPAITFIMRLMQVKVSVGTRPWRRSRTFSTPLRMRWWFQQIADDDSVRFLVALTKQEASLPRLRDHQMPIRSSSAPGAGESRRCPPTHRTSSISHRLRMQSSSNSSTEHRYDIDRILQRSNQPPPMRIPLRPASIGRLDRV